MTEEEQEIFRKLKEKKEMPDISKGIENKDIPDTQKPNDKNCIEIDGKLLEIHPTKLSYFRNNAVGFYHVIDTIPLPVIFQMTEENSKIDGDKAVLTFLSAVLDNAKLAMKIYDKIDGAQLLKIVAIFKRLNGIEEREEHSKNVATAKAKQ